MPSKQKTSRRWAITRATAGPEARGGGPGADPFMVVTHGAISKDDLQYALSRLNPVLDKIAEPLLLARVKLTLAEDPGRARPAIAQVMLDIRGDLVRAHTAAETMPLAIDLVRERLRDQLDHQAQRRRAIRRRRTTTEPGEWRHGDQPTARPDYFDRPIEGRELVRHKMLAFDELAPEEAVFDMEQMDYDFYLFTDLQCGEDALVEREQGGGYRLTSLHPTEVEPEPSLVSIAVSEHPPPRLSVEEAIERLEAIGSPFLFFCNTDTGRGNVVYHRYDGHYGLIAPAYTALGPTTGRSADA
ncbi:MAG: HPF/RaiA family ribosome-associated protein [Acidimicrobiia bacterium]